MVQIVAVSGSNLSAQYVVGCAVAVDIMACMMCMQCLGVSLQKLMVVLNSVCMWFPHMIIT